MNLAPFIYALGWSLLHSLWQGALLCGMAYILLSIFYLSSKEKVNLLSSLLGLLLVAFVGTFIAYWPQKNIEQSINEFIVLTTPKTDSSPVGHSSLQFQVERYFPQIAVIYSIGFLVQLILLIGGYIRIRQLQKSPRIAVPTHWQTTFEHLSRLMHVHQKVGFYLSSSVHAPTVIGYFKPIILFPIAVVSVLEIKQVEAILIHELTHIRRYDYLWNIVKCIVETMLFFNPFAWVLGRMLTQEREHVCDDEVLKLTDNAVGYAQALLVLESMRSKKAPALALGAFSKREYLLERIKRITIMKTGTLNVKHKLAAMIFMLAGFIGLAWINPSADTLKGKDPIAKAMATKIRVSTGSQEKVNVPPLPLPMAKAVPSVPPAPPAPVKEPAPIKPIPAKSIKKQDTLRNQQTFNAIDDSLEKVFSSKKWKDYERELQQNSQKIAKEAQKIQDHFNSSEWKSFQQELAQQAEEMAANGKRMNDFFASPTWKNHMKAVEEQAKQMGLLAIRHDSTYFHSDEWKEKEKAIAANSKQLAQMVKSLEAQMNTSEMKQKREELLRKTDSFKEQAETFRKLLTSPAFKAKQQELQEKMRELNKKAITIDQKKNPEAQ
ncbi:hypothetical protein GCM10023231_35030 [Olivibacter ginsenosidimutans]|uniref:Peptidase M56 domain-containing protein n=1 Tax=Olivibacter ginsenosidimutans TaxID=1176537 RepID=A0ABP9C516_9SPHI